MKKQQYFKCKRIRTKIYHSSGRKESKNSRGQRITT